MRIVVALFLGLLAHALVEEASAGTIPSFEEPLFRLGSSKLRFAGTLEEVRFNADETTLYVSSSSSVRLFSLSSGELLVELPADTVLSQDGKVLVAIRRHHWLQLRSSSTGELLAEREDAQLETLLALSADARSLVVNGVGGPQWLSWDGTTLNERSFGALDGSLRAAAFSPDGSLLVASIDRGFTADWPYSRFDPLGQWTPAKAPPAAVQLGKEEQKAKESDVDEESFEEEVFDDDFEDDGAQRFAGRSTLLSWDTASGERRATAEVERKVLGLRFSPEGDALLAASFAECCEVCRHELFAFEATTLTLQTRARGECVDDCRLEVLAGGAWWRQNAQQYPLDRPVYLDNNVTLAAGFVGWELDSAGGVIVYHGDDGYRYGSLPQLLSKQDSLIDPTYDESAILSQDGSRLLAIGATEWLLLDTRTAKPLGQFPAARGRPVALSSSLIVTASEQRLYVFGSSDGGAVLAPEDAPFLSAIAYQHSPPTFFAASAENDLIYRWDLSNTELSMERSLPPILAEQLQPLDELYLDEANGYLLRVGSQVEVYELLHGCRLPASFGQNQGWQWTASADWLAGNDGQNLSISQHYQPPLELSLASSAFDGPIALSPGSPALVALVPWHRSTSNSSCGGGSGHGSLFVFDGEQRLLRELSLFTAQRFEYQPEMDPHDPFTAEDLSAPAALSAMAFRGQDLVIASGEQLLLAPIDDVLGNTLKATQLERRPSAIERIFSAGEEALLSYRDSGVETLDQRSILPYTGRQLRSLVLAPDFSFVASLEADGTISVWNAGVAQLEQPKPYGGSVAIGMQPLYADALTVNDVEHAVADCFVHDYPRLSSGALEVSAQDEQLRWRCQETSGELVVCGAERNSRGSESLWSLRVEGQAGLEFALNGRKHRIPDTGFMLLWAFPEATLDLPSEAVLSAAGTTLENTVFGSGHNVLPGALHGGPEQPMLRLVLESPSAK